VDPGISHQLFSEHINRSDALILKSFNCLATVFGDSVLGKTLVSEWWKLLVSQIGKQNSGGSDQDDSQ
jgi:hypothetical protein